MNDAKAPPHRLYLSKSERDEDQYIDKGPLPQHQIDGVRFIHRTFKKNKRGVILNDPSGYGKKVQVVLFVDAVICQLISPALVLCKKGKEQEWYQHFCTWSRLEKEQIFIASWNPKLDNARVFIHPICHLNAFNRNDWSILVVDNDVAPRELLLNFSFAHFKIWVTSVDMKENLDLFFLIYNWINNKNKYGAKDFQTTSKRPSVVYMKSVMLDRFMEDVLIRRKNVSLPIANYIQAPRVPIVSKKNKDSTGTKIKRTKRKPDENNKIFTDSNIKNTKVHNNEEKGKSTDSESNFNNANAVKMDTSKPKSPDTIKNYPGTSTSSNIADTCCEIKSTSKIIEDDQDNNYDLNSSESTVSVEKIILEDNINQLNTEDTNSQSIVIRYESDPADVDNGSDPKINEISNSNNIKSENLFSTQSLNELINGAYEVEEPKDLSGETPLKHEIIDKNVLKSGDDEPNFNVHVDAPNELKDKDKFKSVNPNEISSDTNEICNKEYSAVNETDPENESKLNDIDAKIKRMEKQAMNKYKGSILDSIF